MAKWITAQELVDRMTSADPPIVIDVRLAQIGQIPGAHHVPVTDLEDKEWHWDADRDLVVFCQYGRGASDYASEVLEEQGYTRVFKLKGGLDAWNALFGAWREQSPTK